MPCGPTQPEQHEPSLVPNAANECSAIHQCDGDHFCDRGRCSPVLVDPYGHGYGAEIVRREPPALEDTCLGFLAIGRSCSSCLADSECYPEAPYCALVPNRPEGRSCSPYPESQYYDARGEVSPTFGDAETAATWLASYRSFLDYYARYGVARAEAGLPIPPAPTAIAAEAGGNGR